VGGQLPRLGQRRQRREIARQARAQIRRVVPNVDDDLALHRHPKEGVQVLVFVETLAAERDIGKRGQRQPRHRLAVGAHVLEIPTVRTDRWAAALELSQVAEILVEVPAQPDLLQPAPGSLVLFLTHLLSIPRRIRARLKVEDQRQLVEPLARHGPRAAESVNGVERDDRQDPQRSPGCVAEEERHATHQTASRHEAGSQVRHGTAPPLVGTPSGSARDR
jgi:hypothetical protein